MTYLAIDPGIHTGWAVLDSAGTLHACGKGEAFPILSNRAAIIECPQVYRAGKSKADPNNLITLAVRVGRYQERLIAAGVPCDLVLPAKWKGQLPKDTHHLRVDATLSERERHVVSQIARLPGERGYSEDVWDAVALAKWFFASRVAISHGVR